MRLRYRSFVSIVVTMMALPVLAAEPSLPYPLREGDDPRGHSYSVRQPPGGSEGYPQGPNARVHVRQRDTELAGCEARGGPGIQSGLFLSDRKLEGGGLRDGTR